jgi:hypothetical protein
MQVDELESDYDLPEMEERKDERRNKSTIPFDVVNIPRGDKSLIEKFLSWKESDNKLLLLVKYRNMSYHDCDWLDQDVIEADKSQRARVRKFLSKPLWDLHYSEDEPFNPSYLKVDRVIDDGELDNSLFLLVKWSSLPYDEATWESFEFINSVCLANIVGSGKG